MPAFMLKNTLAYELVVAVGESGGNSTVRRRQVSRAALLAALVGDVRRQLSLQAVRQQARLLIDRIATVGNGTGAAAQRRDWAVELEAAASRGRRAQEVSRRQGRNIVRHGFGLV